MSRRRNEKLAVAIARSGMSQVRIAQDIGISAVHLSRLIGDETIRPRRITARALAKVLNQSEAKLGFDT